MGFNSWPSKSWSSHKRISTLVGSSFFDVGALVWNVIEVYNEGVILDLCPFLLFPLSSCVLLQIKFSKFTSCSCTLWSTPFSFIAKFCQKEKFNFFLKKVIFEVSIVKSWKIQWVEEIVRFQCLVKLLIWCKFSQKCKRNKIKIFLCY